jgi:zinc protease
MRRALVPAAITVLCLLPPACATGPEPILVAPSPSASAPLASAAPAASDPLGPRPLPPEPPPFLPPTPKVFAGPGGSKVWLLERHNLPLVSVALVVPVGAAAEPADRGGLSVVTADMLDEGAGGRDAIAFSSALEELGARLGTGSDRDRSVVRLESLASSLPEALALVGDAVLRPRHREADWKRVSSLWQNAIKARGDDPNDVARLATSAAFFGLTHPYGKPLEGTLASAQRVKLHDVSRWHKAIWRPDIATFVVVGDTTQAAITELLSKAFAGWTAPREPPPTFALPSGGPPPPHTVMIDRPDAPQVVVSVVRSGVPADSPELPRLDVLNVALGGSFTSRLNQNLREDHGWTYGARSRFQAQRKAGVFLARAAIRTDAVSDALREMLKEINAVARKRLTDDELGKVRALARADAIDTYGQVPSIASTLANDAGLGLPADHEARALAAQTTVTRADLAQLAARQLPVDGATIVLVGPRKAIEQALSANGLPPPEERDAEGRPVIASSGKQPSPKPAR